MNDNQVLAIVIAILNAGLPTIGIPGVTVLQNYQPRIQGVPTTPVVYLHKINAPRYGFPGQSDVYNSSTQLFDHVDSFWRTPSWQVNGLSTQDPADTTQLTASDIVEGTADVLQLPSTRTQLLQNNIGILRITDVRETYFIDDRDRHEQQPSFDFTLTYQRMIQSTENPVTCFNLDIDRI